MIFKWKEAFSCSIPEIDKQHIKLFEIGSELYSIATSKDGLDHYDEIMGILNELKNYTVEHFKYEEIFMAEHNYPGFLEHKREHKNFISKILELENKEIDDNQSKVTLDIIEFIATWIQNHILKNDHKYKAYLLDKGII